MDAPKGGTVKLDNLFYSEPIFGLWDFNRKKLGILDRLRIIFYPTYVQVSDGYAFHYKRAFGRVYLLKIESVYKLQERGLCSACGSEFKILHGFEFCSRCGNLEISCSCGNIPKGGLA